MQAVFNAAFAIFPRLQDIFQLSIVFGNHSNISNNRTNKLQVGIPEWFKTSQKASRTNKILKP